MSVWATACVAGFGFTIGLVGSIVAGVPAEAGDMLGMIDEIFLSG